MFEVTTSALDFHDCSPSLGIELPTKDKPHTRKDKYEANVVTIPACDVMTLTVLYFRDTLSNAGSWLQ